MNMTRTHHVTATVLPNGEVHLNGLPFSAGQQVRIEVHADVSSSQTIDNPYPLRGLPYTFIDPTEPVAAEDWEAIN
jgi:hypothetical protein